MHLEAVKKTFKGKLYSQYHNPSTKAYVDKTGLNAFEGAGNKGLGRNKLHHGSNSGYQAINMAYLLGASKIILLGYNMGRPNGKAHFFGDHPEGLRNGHYEAYIKHFTRLAEDLAREGVEVINCTPDTLLTQFKRAELEAVL